MPTQRNREVYLNDDLKHPAQAGSLPAVVDYFVGRRMNQEGYRYLNEVQPYERKEAYILDVMGDFTYGKDVHVYSLADFLYSTKLSIRRGKQDL